MKENGAGVCMCVCLRANHFDVVSLGVKVDQGLPCVCHYIPRSSGKPLEGLYDGAQAPVVLWSSKPDIRRASEWDLVVLSGNSDRSDLTKDQVGGGIAWEKGDGRIKGE